MSGAWWLTRATAVTALAATAAAWAAATVAPEGAEAGSYVARFCHEPAPQQLGTEGLGEQRNTTRYEFANTCPSRGSLELRKPVNSVNAGAYRTVYWQTPAEVWLTRVSADVLLRRENGHQSELYVATRSGTKHVLASGISGGGWRGVDVGVGHGWHRVGLNMFCGRAHTSCPGGSDAHAFGKNFRIWLVDAVKPTLDASGSAVSDGWKRGEVGVEVTARDAGSGVWHLGASVNGQNVPPHGTFACARLLDGTVASMQPCQPSQTSSATYNTAASPWRDGQNHLVLCAYDYASSLSDANAACRTWTVNADNTPPTAAFRNAQDPNDPELIRVGVDDQTSGIADGSGRIRYRRVGTSAWSELETTHVGAELQARVDSERPEPGGYEFEASVSDRAGNVATTSTRADGSPMRLSFPLREDVRLSYRLNGGGGQQAARITYNGRRGLSGRLVSAEGDPIANAPVRVVERFVGRARPKRRATERTTDGRGAFSGPLARGPSRSIWVTYRGSRRYRPTSPGRRLGLRVRSHARLTRATRRVLAGNRAVFRGRIGIRGAVVPTAGKLYELQVKQGPRKWTTVSQARHTRSNGRLRFTYRFGRFYTRPTSFRFRIKVTREPGWPYLTPVRSNVRRVTVVPRG